MILTIFAINLMLLKMIFFKSKDEIQYSDGGVIPYYLEGFLPHQ